MATRHWSRRKTTGGMDGWARAYDRMRPDFKLTEPQARGTVKAVRSEDQLKQLDHQDGKVK
ncbi:hypothetical protein [Hymenobacter sedentarius]|uniref:hypothetical protein n=1 Tax=Hymenobacter sedentarius TaxID=1411621 RepID=UPI0012FE7956|nr:hypothetical protein [Hymenobacter sedentarius]